MSSNDPREGPVSWIDPAGRRPVSDSRLRALQELQSALGYRFSDVGLLDRALTHSSFHHQTPSSSGDYENLEFLGDAILDLVISEELYRRFPKHSSGELSKLRSNLVSGKPLAALSAAANLDRYVRLSPGEERTGGRRKKAILSDVFESLIAAIYLDGGLQEARRWILQNFTPRLESLRPGGAASSDYKSRLQELLHSRRLKEPDYRVLEERGPDHLKEFLVEAWIGDQPTARAWGRSKKEAEQKAAQLALEADET